MPQSTSGGIQRECKYKGENKKLHKVDLLYPAGLTKHLIFWLKLLLITTVFNHSGKKKYFKQEVLFRGTGENYMTAYLLFFGPFLKSCLVFIFINYHVFCVTVK